MKKLVLTIAIALTIGLSAYAQDGGLLNRGVSFDKRGGESGMMKGDPNLPPHDNSGDYNGPVGSGVAVLLGLGAAYLVGKKRNEK